MLDFKLELEFAKAPRKVTRPYCCGHYMPVKKPICCSGVQIMVDEHSGAVRVVLIKTGKKRCCD